ncbi:MAG: helix-turn-helix domain-containing protein [Pseudomonadota bacterium]
MSAKSNRFNAREFVATYIEAWNCQDSEAVLSHMADEGTYRDITHQQQLSRQQFSHHLDDEFVGAQYAYALVGDVCTGGDSIAFQYKALPLSGSGVSWYGSEFITLKDGSAVEIADYYEAREEFAPRRPVVSATSLVRAQRYAKSGLSPEQLEEIKSRLIALMENEKLFLTPDLTLPMLAEQLGASVNHVSQVINAGFGTSFFDFINNYRIREATRMLDDDVASCPTVLTVALDVGFNSTSTFYVAFKKVTGRTPAQYRRSAQQTHVS